MPSSPVAIPEPGTLFLFVTGALAVLAARLHMHRRTFAQGLSRTGPR